MKRQHSKISREELGATNLGTRKSRPVVSRLCVTACAMSGLIPAASTRRTLLSYKKQSIPCSNWYKRSTICYAYLFDYEVQAGTHDQKPFRASKWFTRGWTLQELIAPPGMVFYDLKWAYIGSRTDLRILISSITRISTGVLAGEDLELSSIAQRMSWASMRKTTRAEDMAYCVLGIFAVNIPLIYGEGGVDAFIRLQKVIMEKSDDHSLFAWRQEDGPAGHGLLATSPALFDKSLNVIPHPETGSKSAYRMTNRGLEIQLFVTSTLPGGDLFALLDCKEAAESRTMGIFIAPMKDGRFVRIRLDQLGSLTALEQRQPTRATIYIPQLFLPEKPPQQVIRFQTEESETNFKSRSEPSRLLKSVNSVVPSSMSIVPKSTAETYTPIFRTKPGYTYDLPGILNLDLMMGGRAGVLLIPSHLFSLSTGYIKVRRAIVIVFGVNVDKSVYVHIAKFRRKDPRLLTVKKIVSTEPHPTSLRLDETQTVTWFDESIEQLSVDSDKRTSEIEAYNLLFSGTIGEERYQGAYRVIISYTPKRDK